MRRLGAPPRRAAGWRWRYCALGSGLAASRGDGVLLARPQADGGKAQILRPCPPAIPRRNLAGRAQQRDGPGAIGVPQVDQVQGLPAAAAANRLASPDDATVVGQRLAPGGDAEQVSRPDVDVIAIDPDGLAPCQDPQAPEHERDADAKARPGAAAAELGDRERRAAEQCRQRHRQPEHADGEDQGA